ncbi:hypothetical protein ACIQAA_27510 [Neobacillus sp. NPDC093182]|uniref:hypothetical protein n=1 Tax=Neobacillus sp. NPDC093182 TaxID=3364297 RepID=UPI00382AB52D
MSSISHIISNLENELQLLLIPYKEKIEKLKLENQKLISEINYLKEEKGALLEELNILKKKELEASASLKAADLLDDSLPGTLEDDNSCILLSEFNDSIEVNDMEKVHHILELFCKKPDLLREANHGIKDLVYNILHYVIVADKLENEFSDRIVGNFFRLLLILRKHHNAYITLFLKENYPDLLDCALYINEPKTIIRFLKLLYEYQFKSELTEALAHIFKVEWGFLDSIVSKAEFCFFLWYSFLFDLDQELLDRTEEARKWLVEKNSVFQLYTFMYDCVNANKVTNKQKQQDLILGFNQNKIFDSKETQRILDKVHEKLDFLIITTPATTLPTYTNALQMVDSTKLNQLIKELQLQKRNVLVPLYTNGTVSMPSGGYASVTIYEGKKKKKKKKKAFIAREIVDEINQRNYPERIKTEKYVEHVQPSPSIMIKQKETTFQWPSTVLKENPENHLQDKPALNEYSELKKQGYQITGLTRAKRWEILQKAVPSLGLKKVAYTIAYNIRLRKGHKNGLTKFSYSIGEWEHDLERLKKTYYKKEFTWPNF